MRISLAVETTEKNEYFFATLNLPATQEEIKDAMQRARMTEDEHILSSGIEITRCEELPELSCIGISNPTIAEMNFLAKRLQKLSPEERQVMDAIIYTRNNLRTNEDGIPVKDLINLTYGLGGVRILSDVQDLKQLGKFVIENGMLGEICDLPEDALKLLDAKEVGRRWQKIDGGIFWNNMYIVDGNLDPPEVYDGKHLPEKPDAQDFICRVEVAKALDGKKRGPVKQRAWFNLPMDIKEANLIAQNLFGVDSIKDCVFYRYESIIPQIYGECENGFEDFDRLNQIAHWYPAAPESAQIKYKAVLERLEIDTIENSLESAVEVIHELDRYDFAYYCNNENDYFHEFLLRHMDKSVDPRWVQDINVPTSGRNMVKRIGAVCTKYGIVSARDAVLFEPIPYAAQENSQTQFPCQTL